MGSEPSEICADVSVIVPAFNVASTIDRALKSVLNQTLLPKEIIVVDDGSEDETVDVVSNFSSLSSTTELILIRQHNQGAGAARNRAIAVAKSKYVAFLDADDEWEPRKIVRSMEVIDRNDRIFVAHNGWVITGSDTVHNDIATRYAKWRPTLFHGLYRRGFISTSSVVARLEAIKSVGAFDESLPVGQDFDLWLRLAHNSDSNFEVFAEDLTKYHVQPAGITSQTDRRLKCGIVIALNHAPKLRAHPGHPMLSIWFRIIAIFYEALSVYFSRGEIFHAARTLILMPLVTVRATVRYHFTGRSESDENQSMTPNLRRCLAATAYVWAGVMFGLYAYQLKDLIPSILGVFGII